MDSKITYKDYYLPPKLDHFTGDIWKNLPTFGLLKPTFCSGIVITPACDLANSKVETLTYLPIIKISELFASRIFYPVIRSLILNLSSGLEGLELKDFLIKNFLATSEEVNFLYKECSELVKQSPKNKPTIARIQAGLNLIKDIIDAKVVNADNDKLKKFFLDKELSRVKTDLIINRYSNDLHFMPCDKEILNGLQFVNIQPYYLDTQLLHLSKFSIAQMITLVLIGKAKWAK